jgi:hypothetical protein
VDAAVVVPDGADADRLARGDGDLVAELRVLQALERLDDRGRVEEALAELLRRGEQRFGDTQDRVVAGRL